MDWIHLPERMNMPREDKSYLVAYYIKEWKKYSSPTLAYWIEAEGRFFSAHTYSAHALLVDVWLEIPDLS